MNLKTEDRYGNEIKISDEDGTEFYVNEDIKNVNRGVYLRTEEIYSLFEEEGKYIAFSTTGMGPDEVDYSYTYVKEAIRAGKLIQKEHSTSMHD